MDESAFDTFYPARRKSMSLGNQENLSYSQKIQVYEQKYCEVGPLRACLEALESSKQEMENLKRSGQAISHTEYLNILQQVAQAFSDTLDAYKKLETLHFPSDLRTYQQYGLLILLQEIEKYFDETSLWFTNSKSVLEQKRQHENSISTRQGKE